MTTLAAPSRNSCRRRPPPRQPSLLVAEIISLSSTLSVPKGQIVHSLQQPALIPLLLELVPQGKLHDPGTGQRLCVLSEACGVLQVRAERSGIKPHRICQVEGRCAK